MQELNINITSQAAQKVKEILSEPDIQATGLRIFVQGGGCSGFQYGFSLEDISEEDDYTFTVEGVEFYVDYMSSAYLSGATIDYSSSPFSSSFVITNPNAKTTCGCGSSFSA